MSDQPDPIPVAIDDIPIWPTVKREGDRYVRCAPPPLGSIKLSSPRVKDDIFDNISWIIFEVDGKLWKQASML